VDFRSSAGTAIEKTQGVSPAIRGRPQRSEEQEAVRKEVAIEQVVDTTSDAANYMFSGEEKDLPSYPSVDAGEGGEQTEQ